MEARNTFYDELINPLLFLEEQEWMQRWLTSSLEHKDQEYDNVVEYYRDKSRPRELNTMMKLTKISNELVGDTIAADIYRKLALIYMLLLPDDHGLYDKMADFADTYILLVNRFLQDHGQTPIKFVTEFHRKRQLHGWVHDFPYFVDAKGTEISIVPLWFFDRIVVAPFYDKFKTPVNLAIKQGIPGFSIYQTILYFVAHKMVAECLTPRLLSKVL